MMTLHFTCTRMLCSAGAIVGLLLIACGSGGIKPCVSSFGADQFGSSEREQRAMSRFFSIFYFAINVGSLLSIIVSPILRGASRSLLPRVLVRVRVCNGCTE